MRRCPTQFCISPRNRWLRGVYPFENTDDIQRRHCGLVPQSPRAILKGIPAYAGMTRGEGIPALITRHPVTAGEEGTGLGLIVCRDLLESLIRLVKRRLPQSKKVSDL